jgi:ubiquinone/menaquinone biosynthesis C-methylase UbiE
MPTAESQTAAAQRMYNVRAHEYNDSWHPAFAQYVVDFLAPSQGAHVLDLACGTGLVSFAAARAVGPTGSVTGVDISDGMLNVAKQELERLKAGEPEGYQNLRFFNHSITDLSSLEAIRGQKFDAITCASALVLLDYPFDAINMWTQFLKPGGALVTDAIHPRNLIGGVAMERTCTRLGVRAPSQRLWIAGEQSFRDLLEATGLDVTKIEFKNQAAFKTRVWSIEQGEEVWERNITNEAARPLKEAGAVDKAKEMFLEDWKLLADKDGNIEEVDGVWTAKAIRTNDAPPKVPVVTGACACGAVTWKAVSPPVTICNCFCVPCRKVSGAPFLSLLEFPTWALSIMPRLSELKGINLTPHARRTFCGECGSTLTFQHFQRIDQIEVSMGTMDEECVTGRSLAEAFQGVEKSWCYTRSKVSWYDSPADDWEKYETMKSEKEMLVYDEEKSI